MGITEIIQLEKEYADFSKFLIEERKKLKMISKRLILFNDPSVLNQLNSNNLPMEEKNEHK